VYAVVPPDGVTEAVPVLPPLHNTPVELVVVDIAVGCVIVTDVVKLHPFLSFTVHVYEPAVRPVMLEVVCPLLHVYVYAVVPPEGVTEAVPVLPPPHNTPVWAVVADKAAG
jgi:hypothetical protein